MTAIVLSALLAVFVLAIVLHPLVDPTRDDSLGDASENLVAQSQQWTDREVELEAEMELDRATGKLSERDFEELKKQP